MARKRLRDWLRHTARSTIGPVRRFFGHPVTLRWGSEGLAWARAFTAGFLALCVAFFAAGITLAVGDFDVTFRVLGLLYMIPSVPAILISIRLWSGIRGAANELDLEQNQLDQRAAAQRQAMVDELRTLNAALAPRSRALRRSARPHY